MKTVILDHVRIERILNRISIQILEHCFSQKQVTLIGIKPRGVWVADQLEKHLKKIASFEIKKVAFDIGKEDDIPDLRTLINKQTVVLVDDVIKSGFTMMMAASTIVQYEPNQLITACLVDRKHRRFPIQSDFTGLSLATTLQEHILLEIKPKPTIFLE